MNLILKPIFLVFLILFLFPTIALCQVEESRDSLNNELIAAARNIMTAANTCALITIDKEGVPRARAMDAFLPEDDFTVWFGTNPQSAKVEQIRSNPKVSLYYLESGDSGYVTIHGIAQIVNDEEEKKKRWKDEWEAFYKNKSEDYILIKVSPEWMEVVSYAHGIVSKSKSWGAPKVVFD